MAECLPGGVWPAVLTCLDEDRQPCEANTTKLVDLFVEQGVGGLYVLGSTGQGPALDVPARKRVMELFAKANAGRLPLMTHVGAVSPYDAMELARHAADHGADAISSVPPIYFKADLTIMFAHYQAVASATDLPFYPYHFNVTGLPALDDYVRRLLEIPHIQGMKVTDSNLFIVEMIRSYAGDKLHLFSGADELILQGAISGADGAIGSFYNMFAPAVIKARDAFLGGDIEAGRRFMGVFSRVIYDLIRDYASVGVFFRKAMLLRHGIDIGPGVHSASLVNKPLDDARVLDLCRQVDEAAGL